MSYYGGADGGYFAEAMAKLIYFDHGACAQIYELGSENVIVTYASLIGSSIRIC